MALCLAGSIWEDRLMIGGTTERLEQGVLSQEDPALGRVALRPLGISISQEGLPATERKHYRLCLERNQMLKSQR